MSENQAPMLEVRGLTKHFDVSPPLTQSSAEWDREDQLESC